MILPSRAIGTPMTFFSFVQVDDSPNPLQFSQVFHLIPDGASYYVYVHLQCSSPHETVLITTNSASMMYSGSITVLESL